MVTCPRCNKEVTGAAKEWNYAAFHVKLFKCAKCDKGFMAYYRGGKLSHTIPKSKK
jgi:transposase-like protein